jgi:outer membrane protein assembly factor BamB
MRTQFLKSALFGTTCFTWLLAASNPAAAEDWTRFRGPNGSGIASTSFETTAWSDKENVKWKIDLPGYGSSSPIVVGDQVIVTCYSGYGLDVKEPGEMENLTRHLLSFDRQTGKELWRKDIKSTEEEDLYKGFISEHGYASSTPASDGQHVFAFFGKSGVFAFDMKGNQVWQKNLGNFSDPAKWGDGSSPIVYQDLVIVNAGIVGHKLVALKKSDGSVAWELEDEQFTNCWSTPILVKTGDREELVVSMPGQIIGLNPATGEKLWNAKSPIERTVCASLAEEKGVVFAMGGQGGVGIAIRCGGQGDVSETHKVWEAPLRAGIGTPVVVDGKLYWSSSGMAFCASCVDGKEVFKERLKAESAQPPSDGKRRGPAGDYASPIVIGNKIIIFSRNGSSAILNASDKLDVVAMNSMGEDTSLFNATPAFANGNLFVRSNKALYCIGK